MMKFFLLFLVFMFAINSYADDWGAPSGTIDSMFVYPSYAVITQSIPYAGTAGCGSNSPSAWSFYWADFDAATQQRIYSALLAARMAKTPFKPIFTSSGCGPEGYKKFNGLFVLY